MIRAEWHIRLDAAPAGQPKANCSDRLVAIAADRVADAKRVQDGPAFRAQELAAQLVPRELGAVNLQDLGACLSQTDRECRSGRPRTHDDRVPTIAHGFSRRP